MPKSTIEQRWKAVGVEREEIARSLFNDADDRVYGEISNKLYETLMNSYLGYADALLPLIEKAVREARKDEHKKPALPATLMIGRLNMRMKQMLVFTDAPV